MPPPDEAGEVAPEPARSCRSCLLAIRFEALFCPHCGVEQDRHGPVRRLRERREREHHGWLAIRGTIVFYLIYLGTILPLLWTPEEHRATALLVLTVVDAGIVAFYWAVSGIRLRDALAPTRPAAVFAVAGSVALLPMLVVNVLYHGGLLRLFGVEGEALAEPFEAAGYGMAVQLLILAVAPGVVEEIAFRGLMLERLAQAVTRAEALLLTSMLFAIIHVSLWSAPYLLALGFALGWLRLRSGSLLPCMVVHALHNAAVLLYEHAGG